MTGPEHYRAAEQLLALASPTAADIQTAQAHLLAAVVRAVMTLSPDYVDQRTRSSTWRGDA